MNTACADKRRHIVRIVPCLIVFASLTSTAQVQTIQMRQYFSSAPGWQGVNNVPAPSIAVGIVATLIAMNLQRLGIITGIGNRVIQTFTGPVLGIFWLGMFSSSANSPGVFVGGVVGAGAAVFTAFGLQGIISWMWPCVFGLFFTLAVGYSASYLFSASEKGRTWNWFAIVR